MELCSSSPNLAGASQANGAMLRLLRTQFRVYYLGLKCIRGVVSGVKGLTRPSPLAKIWVCLYQRWCVLNFLDKTQDYL